MGLIWDLSLGDEFAVLQASMLDGLSLDVGTLGEDGLVAAEVDVGGCQIVHALVVATMIVVLDERADLGFEIAGQVAMFEQDAVFQCLMPAFDLALDLGMIWRVLARASSGDRRASRPVRLRHSLSRCH